MKYLVFHFIISAIFCHSVNAQSKVVHIVAMEGDQPVHGATVFINSKAQSSTNVSGQAFAQYEIGDTLLIRSIVYEPISRILSGDTPTTISVDLTPKIHHLQEVAVRPVNAEELIKKAFYSIPKKAMTGNFMLRQYIAENGSYNKISEGIGMLYIPTSIWDFGNKKGRIVNKDHIELNIQAICLPHSDQKTNAVYAFDPTELIIRGLTSNAVFDFLHANNNSTSQLLADDDYWYITISQQQDAHRQVHAEWIIDKNSGQLISASEKQSNKHSGETHRFEFEFLSIADQTYLYRAFHEHTKKGRKTAYIGGQEMFFSFAGSQGEKMAKKTFNSKRPDLSRLKKELIDCAAVRDYVQRQNLPQLHF